jgi:putative lipoic acid-binding regulatory protein
MASEPGVVNEEEARARALSLLEATHQFPCDYAVTVIAFNRQEVTEAVLATCSPPDRPMDAPGDGDPSGRQEAGAPASPPTYEARASREGKYLSHRLAVRVADATQVLELYARLRSLEGVVTIL